MRYTLIGVVPAAPDRAARKRERRRTLHAITAARRENMPRVVPIASRTSAKGTNGAPMFASDDLPHGLPTDPATGAMVEPDLPLPNYVTK